MVLSYSQKLHPLFTTNIDFFLSCQHRCLTNFLRLSHDWTLILDLLSSFVQAANTRCVTTLHVIFTLPIVLPTLHPALFLLSPPLLGKLHYRWPVDLVVILKLNIAVKFVPQLLRRNVLSHVIVEFELLPCERVDERCDELEEAIYKEGNCFVLDNEICLEDK